MDEFVKLDEIPQNMALDEKEKHAKIESGSETD